MNGRIYLNNRNIKNTFGQTSNSFRISKGVGISPWGTEGMKVCGLLARPSNGFKYNTSYLSIDFELNYISIVRI